MARSSTERDDVFVAIMVSRLQDKARSFRTLDFTSISSNTASITRSVSSWMESTPTPSEMLEMIPSTFFSEKILLCIASSRNPLMVSIPRCTKASSLSTICTAKPSWADFWVIPDPIFPAPITATRSIGPMTHPPAFGS